MSQPDQVQTMRSAFDAYLQQFIDRSLNANYPGIREMIVYHMGWEGEGAGPEAQGKRIRPQLVLLCAEAAGTDWRRALPAAASVELLHNFSLIHDDIQDNSPLRHNRPTMWVKWGVAQAINTGDIMFTLSFHSLPDLMDTLPPAVVLDANRILHETCLRLTEGQYLDISYENSPNLPMESYWPMITGKTSALLACSCELGALVAGASPQRRTSFREYGSALGLAFQVLDDWLGIWGEPLQTGKSAASDLVSGKKTLPVLFALANDGPFARRWMRGSITPDEVPALARMLEEEGAAEKTLQTAEQITNKAMQMLETAVDGSRSFAAEALQELTENLLKRRN